MVPGDRTLIFIGYKYNARKVFSFIVTAEASSTNAGIPYLTKYPDTFSNVAIFPVYCPLFMSKFFGSVNKVTPKNQGSLI